MGGRTAKWEGHEWSGATYYVVAACALRVLAGGSGLGANGVDVDVGVAGQKT